MSFVAGASGGVCTGLGVLSVTIPVPAGTLDGMTMLAAISNDAGDIAGTPAGWTLEADVAIPVIRVYSRIAAAEPANYTWTWAVAVNYPRGIIVTYTDARISPPDNTNATCSLAAQNGNCSAAMPGNAIPITAQRVVYFGNGVSTIRWTTRTWTPPGSITERFTFDCSAGAGVERALWCGDELLPAGPGLPARSLNLAWTSGFGADGGALRAIQLGALAVPAAPGFGFGTQPYGPG